MAKIDIISGFLGAGKTTLIKKLLKEAFAGEQVVLIENEFGEIGVDGGFLKESGIQIREMNSGCICCSLVGDFGASLREVTETYHPDRILIEPSGVGKLSDVIKAVQDAAEEADLELNSYTTVVDAKKAKLYVRNFGEFFNNQVKYAGTIVLSRTDLLDEAKVAEALALVREINPEATVITTPIAQLDGAKILDAMEHPVSFEQEMLDAEVAEHHHHHHHDHDHEEEEHEHHHHHDHDEEEEEHEHHHHHDHDEEEEEHEHHHHHHDHDEEEEEHEHHHHHDHHDHDEEEEEHEHHHHHHDHEEEEGETCSCGHHHHHHDHDADEIFTSWGRETAKKYTKEEIEKALAALSEAEKYGDVLRAKGMVPAPDGTWTYFDMGPEEVEIREGGADVIGRICVIGAQLHEDALAELFGLA